MHLKRCSLAGRTCLVTGGASGIGLAVTAQQRRLHPLGHLGPDHRPSDLLPRLVDVLPRTTPGRVASRIVEALHAHRTVLDTPAYLPLAYAAFDAAPALVQRLLRAGGCGRNDYGRTRSPVQVHSPAS